MKDKNIAVRVTWETWNLLDRLRAQRETEHRQPVTLSDIVREALDNHVGKHEDIQRPNR